MPKTARGLQSEQRAPEEPPTATTNKKTNKRANLQFLLPKKKSPGASFSLLLSLFAVLFSVGRQCGFFLYIALKAKELVYE
jgi:hypothetical protein